MSTFIFTLFLYSSSPFQKREFDEHSTRFCDSCKIDVKIGYGGEGNWKIHIEGGPHSNAVKAMSSNQSIMTFFSKSTGPSKSTRESLAPLTLSSMSSEINALDTSHDGAGTSNESIIIIDDISPSPASALFQRFRAVIDTLPHTVPVAVSADAFACFSGNPTIELGSDEDAWEVVDRALNRVIGYGVSTESVSRLIRRGDLGMNGLYRWLRICVTDLKIEEALLESKIGRLIDAMVML